MLAALFSVIIFSIVVSVFFFYLSSHPYSAHETSASFPALIFSLWLIAVAMWGKPFYAYRFADLFDLTIERFVFGVVILILFAGAFAGSQSWRGKRVIERSLFLFALICMASMTIHGFGPSSSKYASPWFIFISAYLFPFAAFLFAKRYLVAEKNLSLVFHVLFYLGVYLAIIAFFEFFNLRQYVYPRFIADPKILAHWDRARGPFFNAAINGFAIVIGFICGVQLLSFKRGFARLLHLILMTVFFPAVFFTQTRSIYLCFLVTLVTLLVAYRTPVSKWKLFAIPLALVMIFAIVNLPRLESSERREGGVYQVEEVVIREALFRMSLVMVKDNPVFGVGLAQFIPASVARYKDLVPLPATYQPTSQHHQLLAMAVELGLVGLFVYLSITVVFFRRVYSLFIGLPKAGFIDSNLALLIGLALGVYILNNFFIDSSFQLFPNAVFFTFGGMADGLYGQLKLMRTADEGAIPLGFSPSYGA
ncbi:MAG: O-antigen ligase family protein [Syntrophobacteraceae bacterium]